MKTRYLIIISTLMGVLAAQPLFGQPGYRGQQGTGLMFARDLAVKLNLSDQQLQQINVLRSTHRANMAALQAQLRNGSISRNDFQAAIRQQTVAHRAQMEAVLTPEQTAMYKNEINANRQRRQQQQDAFKEAYLESMYTDLKLAPAKEKELRTIMDGHFASMEPQRDKIRSGELSWADAAGNREKARTELRNAVSKVLNANQMKQWEGYMATLQDRAMGPGQLRNDNPRRQQFSPRGDRPGRGIRRN